MEIEKKFLVKALPFDIIRFEKQSIAQSYVSTDPVIRIRKKNDNYILEIKGKGNFSREEHGISITLEQYEKLKKKVDGREIIKDRYLIPLSRRFTAELDIYGGHLEGLMTVEVEFESVDDGLTFEPPDWFGEDVTYDNKYKNSYLSGI